MTHIPKVICFQQRLTHYRETFFDRCKTHLAERSIHFDLVHGKTDASALRKNDRGFLPWAYEVDQRNITLGNISGVWVPMAKGISSPDLVILTQENKLLANYGWLLRRYSGGPKVAFWGHGRNFQSNAPTGLREKWKQLLVGRVDWWLAYTQITRDILLDDGYPDERITVLDNAIDIEAFQADLASVTDDELEALWAKVPASETTHRSLVGLFCGSLYGDKRIGFTIEAADRIRAEIPHFTLVVIGDGPSANEVEAAALTRPWLLWVGVKKGREKAAWFKLARVIFNPGAVGLHVLDAFAAGVPMATTKDSRHGPEIAYLEHAINGLKTEGNVEAYATAVITLLSDPTKYAAMVSAGFEAAKRYTLENMVNRFCTGIEHCLAMPKK
jgi:glycosyltransferase involved in cell wall biosynthesis